MIKVKRIFRQKNGFIKIEEETVKTETEVFKKRIQTFIIPSLLDPISFDGMETLMPSPEPRKIDFVLNEVEQEYTLTYKEI